MVARWLSVRYASRNGIVIGFANMTQRSQSGLFRPLASHSARFYDLHIQANRGYIDDFIASGSYALTSYCPLCQPRFSSIPDIILPFARRTSHMLLFVERRRSLTLFHVPHSLKLPTLPKDKSVQ
jgi:hypothetical protein